MANKSDVFYQGASAEQEDDRRRYELTKMLIERGHEANAEQAADVAAKVVAKLRALADDKTEAKEGE